MKVGSSQLSARSRAAPRWQYRRSIMRRLNFLTMLALVVCSYVLLGAIPAPAHADPVRAFSVNPALGGDRAFLSWSDSSTGQDTSLVRVTCFSVASAGDTAWVLRDAPYSYGNALVEHLSTGNSYYAYAVRRDAAGVELWRTGVLSFRPLPDAATSGLTVAIRTVNAGAFPIITSYVTVADALNAPITDLTAANFTASENGVPQTNLFSVIPPNTGGSTRVADIIFVIDDTGSMGPYIAGVRSSVIDFANRLTTSGVDFRLGLVTFKDYVTDYNGKALTADVSQFNGWVSGLNASGGGDTPEVSFDAVADAATWAVRPGAQRVLIAITDAPSHYRGDGTPYSRWTQSEVIALLTDPAVQAQTNVVSFEFGQYVGAGSLTDATGGTFYHLGSNFSGIIDRIGNSIANQYIVQYQSANPAFDGTDREVRITATRDASSGYAIAHYTPGAAPRMSLTSTTAAALDIAQVAGAPIPVSVQVVDDVPPLVSSVTLRYRLTSSTGAYNAVLMTTGGAGIYQANIPASASVTPGVSFYVEATDGIAASTLPLIDPSTRPLQFAVLPNEPPAITHTPITTASQGSAILVDAVVTDHTHSLSSVRLEYKSSGQFVYTAVDMTPGSGDHYTGTIPGSFVTTGGVNYAIRATDDLGVTSQKGPYTVSVTSGPAPLSVEWAVDPVKSCIGLGEGVFAVGSVRPARWRLNAGGTITPPIQVDFVLVDQSGNEVPGTRKVVVLPDREVTGSGTYNPHWIVPLRTEAAMRLKVVVNDDAGRTGSAISGASPSTPFKIEPLDYFRRTNSNLIVGCIYEFAGSRVIGPASGQVHFRCFDNLLHPKGPPYAYLNCDGTYSFEYSTGSGRECRVCTGFLGINFSPVLQLYLDHGDDIVQTWWTLDAEKRNAQYIGIETDADSVIGWVQHYGSNLTIQPSVVVERPDRDVSSDIAPAEIPRVLINGWTESSGAWGTFSANLQAHSAPVWELYYPSFMMPATNAGTLVARGIQFLTRDLQTNPTVNVVAHSFGAMAVRAYVQNVSAIGYGPDPMTSMSPIERIVFLNGVNHGSHNANQALRSFGTSAISSMIKCADQNDPMFRDMGVGSPFQEKINNSPLPDLTTGTGTAQPGQYICFGSTKEVCFMGDFGKWESDLADGPVSVASTSLLDKGIPLITDGTYNHSENQSNAGAEVANSIDGFFKWHPPGDPETDFARAVLNELNRAPEGMLSVYLSPTYGAAPTGISPIDWEGGLSFIMKAGLERLGPDAAEASVRLVSAQKVTHAKWSGKRFIRGRIEQYRSTETPSGSGRFYAWGWKTFENDNWATKWGDGSSIQLHPLDQCAGGSLHLYPSDEDVTIPPHQYWIVVNGSGRAPVDVKWGQFVWDGDLSGKLVAFYAASPVDLEVADPDGNIVGPSSTTLPGALYDHYRTPDGDYHTFVRMRMGSEGLYRVRVIPMPGADPSATYSLFAMEGGITHTLAEAHSINSVPADGYTVAVASSPDPPLGVTAEAGAASVKVRWMQVKDPRVVACRVFYGTDHAEDRLSGDEAAEGPSGITVPRDQTELLLTCLPDSVFHVAVACVDSDGRQSTWSDDAVATPLRPLARVKLTPTTLNLDSNGRYFNCELSLGSPFSISRIDLSSIRLGGTVPAIVLSTHLGFDAAWAESVITTKFDRQQVETLFPNGGNQPVAVTGRYLGCLDTLTFEGRDTIRVINPRVVKPASGEVVAADADYDIQWSLPSELTVDYVNVLLSTDGGTTWNTLVANVTGRTDFLWRTPASPSSGALIRVDANGGGVFLGRGTSPAFNIGSGTTGVGDGLALPRAVYLSQPRPTPFQSSTTIQYGLPKLAPVRLQVFDVNGRLVRTLVDAIEAPGNKSVVWAGTTDQNAPAGAGIYMVRLEAGGTVRLQRAVLLK